LPERRDIIAWLMGGGVALVGANGLLGRVWGGGRSKLDSGRIWHAAPDGLDDATGSVRDPLSLVTAAAGAGGRVLPGDTILLMQAPGAPDYVYRPDAPWIFSCGGTAEQPITFRPYPGHRPRLDGSLQQFRSGSNAAAWIKMTVLECVETPPDTQLGVTVEGLTSGAIGVVRKLVVDPSYSAPARIILQPLRGSFTDERLRIAGAGQEVRVRVFRKNMNLYRSTVAEAQKGRFIGGNILIDKKWRPLIPDRTGGQNIFADSDLFDGARPYYPGPMCMTDVDGFLYIRLDPPSNEAMLGRKVDTIEDPDPRRHVLRLWEQERRALDLRANHLHFIDLEINDFHMHARCNGAESHLVFDGLSGRCGYFFLRCGSGSDITVRNCDHSGNMLSEGWWCAWMDVKGGRTMATHMRKNWIETGTVRGMQIYRNKIFGFFDGLLGNATDVEIGRYADDPRDEEGHWRNANIFRHIWDDSWQIYASSQRIDIHHNYFLGAGISRDGAASRRQNGPGYPYIHHNIFDCRPYNVFWGRKGVEPDAQGDKKAIPLSQHGPVLGDGWTFPWRFYHNTVIWDEATKSTYMNIGLFSPSAAHNGVQHLVFNNIFIDPGQLYLQQQGVTHFRPFDRDFDSTSGREIYDGNAFVWSGAGAPRYGYRQIKTSAGQNNFGIGSVREMRLSRAFADSKRYYPPGWENSAIELRYPVDVAIDKNYRPTVRALQRDAVDVTSFRLRGMRSYQSWRGAKAPP
jgi:hypothetical protein